MSEVIDGVETYHALLEKNEGAAFEGSCIKGGSWA